MSRVGWYGRQQDWRYGRVIKWRVKNLARRVWTRLRVMLLATWAILRPRAAAVWLQFQRNAREAGVRTYNAGKDLLQRLRQP